MALTLETTPFYHGLLMPPPDLTNRGRGAAQVLPRSGRSCGLGLVLLPAVLASGFELPVPLGMDRRAAGQYVGRRDVADRGDVVDR